MDWGHMLLHHPRVHARRGTQEADFIFYVCWFPHRRQSTKWSILYSSSYIWCAIVVRRVLFWGAHVVPPSSSHARRGTAEADFVFYVGWFSPSSALHEVKHPNVIGRDSWDWVSGTYAPTTRQDFGGVFQQLKNYNLRVRKPNVRTARSNCCCCCCCCYCFCFCCCKVIVQVHEYP